GFLLKINERDFQPIPVAAEEIFADQPICLGSPQIEDVCLSAFGQRVLDEGLNLRKAARSKAEFQARAVAIGVADRPVCQGTDFAGCHTFPLRPFVMHPRRNYRSANGASKSVSEVG